MSFASQHLDDQGTMTGSESTSNGSHDVFAVTNTVDVGLLPATASTIPNEVHLPTIIIEESIEGCSMCLQALCAISVSASI